jgi:hypothetical protein
MLYVVAFLKSVGVIVRSYLTLAIVAFASLI